MRQSEALANRILKQGHCKTNKEIEYCFNNNFGRFLIKPETLKIMNRKQKLKLLKEYNKIKPRQFYMNNYMNFIRWNYYFFHDFITTNYKILRRMI